MSLFYDRSSFPPEYVQELIKKKKEAVINTPPSSDSESSEEREVLVTSNHRSVTAEGEVTECDTTPRWAERKPLIPRIGFKASVNGVPRREAHKTSTK